MKLTKVRIKNFKCIHDSREFDIGDITCLVGKNESGKTAILQALHKFNPFDTAIPGFDRQNEYPVESNNKNEDDIVEVTFSLEQKDIDEIENFITCQCLSADGPTITLSKGYSTAIKVVRYGFDVDVDAIISHISANAKVKLSSSMTDPTKRSKELLAQLDLSEDEQHYRILEAVASSNVRDLIYNSILYPRIPKFIYLDEYPQMNSVVNITQLINSMADDNIRPSDQPILDILSSAEVNYSEIIKPSRASDQGIEIRKATSAIDQVLNEIFEYWSQHEIYNMESEILRANQGDDPILRIYITDNRKPEEGYLTRKPFESESHGFIWFFSFLLMQKHFYADTSDAILLLDEPGLSLHAKAQKDLLRFFEDELALRHQVIYTTHSPFMIDSNHLDRVRLVENQSLKEDSNQKKYSDLGTKVFSNALKVSKGSLLPLQAALGYDISQNMFIGRNNLIVEGTSDLVYIKTISRYLEKDGMEGLDPAWNIVPVGGIDKVPSFTRLFGANTDLDLAVLVDAHKNGMKKIENLYENGIIDENRVLTYADFTDSKEADVEDMLTLNFYLELVERTYGISIKKADLPKRSRVISRLESYFETNPIPNNVRFRHIKPAEHLMANIESIEVPKEVLSRFQKVFDKLRVLSDQHLDIVREGELETKVSGIPVNTEGEEAAAADAAFVSATPASGDLASNGTISVSFDNDPGDVTVSAGTITTSGKTRTISGPFPEGALALALSWTNGDGSHTLNYTVTAPDTTAPTVTGGTVSDGDEDVDPAEINEGGIEITFSEEVTGNIALQTEGGDNVGWIGDVSGMAATLELVAGKEIGNETVYVIKGTVSDAAGNELPVEITFTTAAKE